jgi:predicted transcriptional regulator YdeE
MEMITMEQTTETAVVAIPAFRAVGLKWEGTFDQAAAGGIRAIQKQMKERLGEIAHVLHPEQLLGLSYHVQPGGFTHYSVVEVATVEDVPEGMVEVTVPALTYAVYEHRKGQNIEGSYRNLYAWIAAQGKKARTDDVTHVEQYAMEQDPETSDPEFTILIPLA